MSPHADFLATVMRRRREDLGAARRHAPIERLRDEAAARAGAWRRLALAPDAPAIIAEVKRASPSAGPLCADYQPATLARAYQDGGAAAISVLTEPHWFLGDAAHLRAVRAAVPLPILRKDFISDPYQLWEAAAWGADLALLIVAGLDGAQLADLHAEARAIGLDVLVETHDEAEAERALTLDAALIGVNSRNLRTLKTDLAVARRVGRLIPPDRIAVAESGIRDRADITSLQEAGYRAFLIGETLMRAPDPAAALRALRA